jgi:predicted nucleic acid-binding protein
MKPSVYIDTTIIGYLTSRVSSLLLTAANQQVTREWWDEHRGHFDVFVSRAVVDEADALVARVPLPGKAQVDALHVAVAAVNGVQYLLTWNCKHIANASLRPRIESVCRDLGYEPPSICTPQEIMEI